MARATKLDRLAGLVEQLLPLVEVNGLGRAERIAARAQTRDLIALLEDVNEPGAAALSQVLARLEHVLTVSSSPCRRTADGRSARRRFVRTLRRIAGIVGAGVALSAPLPAAAGLMTSASPIAIIAAGIPVVAVGDMILNPETGLNEEIVEVTGDGTVVTDAGNLIILATVIGETFTVHDENDVPTTYTVTAVTTDIDGQVIGIDVVDGLGAPGAFSIVTDISALLDAVPDFPPGDDGTGDSAVTFPSAAGDVNNYVNSRRGSNGSNGRDGAGIKTCIPGLGCTTVGKSPTSGGNGANGPTVNANVGATTITTTSHELPGVVASSIGGNGGDGGDGWGNLKGASGGRAGRGGTVNANVAATIVTSGRESHGIFAQSRSGRGGDGGTGYIAGSGGGGGNPGQGGDVTVNFTGAISTSGREAIGILAQSLGGAAGGGGDSFGLIGDGGGGSSGGNGGDVVVSQGGVIQTSGLRAHGVLAQSIGGSGGRAGDSGGLATFGDDGGAGGDGGSVHIIARTGSETRTSGEAAFGLFAQSVGGGGGDGGDSSGGWVMGSGGAAGGDGGQAGVTIENGALVATTGADSYAVFVQSVGGGGGSSGRSAGAVALGASGDAGGGADDVWITSAGQVSTEGENARGLFAQSVGGGGGASRHAGGAVAIGGSGGAGGEGGKVEIDVLSGGSVTTLGDSADAIYAQSVGGGGGSAQGASGAVALGGGGGDGGDGGEVAVSNAGFLRTEGAHSRGVFAQSVGGGGGQGGGTGGIASLGGAGGDGSDGGRVTVTNTGVIATSGDLSSAIHAQSIGGGGGDGGGSMGLNLVIGGRGGGGGEGGVVTVEHGGQLFTSGQDSHGIFAQSVGGGGGSGGASQSFAVFGGLSLGGDGGDGGDGGQVDVIFSPRTVTLPTGVVQAPARIVTEGDRSRGAFVQSVGGGGGSGGYAAQISAGYGIGAAIALGGSGGDGGRGGQVTVTGDVDIETAGDNAEGIFAQSVGGGGGAGGFAVSFALSAGDTVSGAFGLGVGGTGGDGGDGGLVTIDSGGSIVTEGQFSTGLFAQSLGGGGGAGGFAVALSGTASGGVAGAVSVGLGGAGGDGGAGGTVDAAFDGSIATFGDDAAGAIIQSVGGGGGRGGFAVTGAVAGATSGSGSAGLGVGGSGGGGGDGGAVSGHVGGPVHTEGDRSAGVVVQSQGGGGGTGGFAVAGSLSASSAASGSVSIGVGGSGGDGGDGGAVVASAGSITTLGHQSDGFVAQSTGGGGGLGGFSVAGNLGVSTGAAGGAANVGVGGAGGGGGHGGDVTATVTGDVTTFGDQSDAIIAQSTGGGGGRGGFAVSGGLSVAKAGAGAAGTAIGGVGGDGGDGGTVTLDVTGLTQTAGADSNAIIAQSTGGGGGRGGFAVTGQMSVSSTGAGTAASGLGGHGGGGGHGDDVTLRVNDGAAIPEGGLVAVVTTGDGARGVLAQSTGGGGGAGGFAVTAGVSVAKTAAGNGGFGVGGGGGGGGDGGAVTAHVTGDVRTAGRDAAAVLVQSTGGGGGAGGFNVTGGVSLSTTASGNLVNGVGGFGGDGGDGGMVTASVTGDILTLGDDSFGVTYQSVGGGGGAGGFNVTGGLSLALTGGAGGAGVWAAGVGGAGGGGGSGADVDGGVTGDIRTEGDRAHGALIQSAGGGGGHGAFNITGGASISSTAGGVLATGVGGFGGGGGGAGDVTGHLTGDIVTLGQDSFGALVQSAGGGGGAGAFNITGGVSFNTGPGVTATAGFGVGGFGGFGGDAGEVTGALIGDVLTQGDGAFGVTYQSVGGGGGKGGFNVTGGISTTLGAGASGVFGFGVGGFGGAGGAGSTVQAAITGDVTTLGDDAHGVLLQSTGGSGGQGKFNVTGGLSVTGSSSATGAVGLGVGGFGGGGGDAGDVTGHLIGDVTTFGDDSFGAMLQSTGGAGGAGAFNITGDVVVSAGTGGAFAGGFGVGGFGGDGGDAGDVTGVVTGDYATAGDRAEGVVVQSVGGGGGKGGFNITGSMALGMNGGTGNASIGVGGFGGAGGSAGDVSLIRVGDTVTDGADSDAIIVQSVGKGGGAGAFNVTGGVSATIGNGAYSFNLGIGGFGGDGGDAGAVSAHITGNVHALGLGSDETDGDRRRRLNGSNGVVVQSLGGGGGTGGVNVSGSLSLSRPGAFSDSRATAIGVGGFGGDGGDAGRVDLVIARPGEDRVQVSAVGDDRAAVIAQSIGGGGGMGGINVSGGIALDGVLTMGVGGFGGDGGNAEDVTAHVDADLFAAGNHARGLMVQSIGGGGGHGGMNISGGIMPQAGVATPSLVFGLGGSGGGGGVAGDVLVSHRGDVNVEGVKAIGVLIQSVAGGGGSGGLSVSGLLSGAGTRGFSTAVSIGGSGGDGSDAGDVTFDSVGDVIVVTDRSARGSTLEEEMFRMSEANGRSPGIVVQSIGGGGGVGGLSFSGVVAPAGSPFVVSMGGSGGSGGHGGAVTVTRGYLNEGGVETAAPGLIHTMGDRSTGLFVQSVGGGGGQAGMSFGFAASVLASPTELPLAALFMIGGDGGGAGSGGDVNVRHSGDIVTEGERSKGLFAQSVGGGGGDADYNVGLGLVSKATAVNLALGGAPGAGGRGGDVTVDHDGIIVTQGERSQAIVAQSLGRGGGNAALSMALGMFSNNHFRMSLGSEGGSGGIGGDVTVRASGVLDTTGDDSEGVFAQSVGGGGGRSGSRMIGVQGTGDNWAHGFNHGMAIGLEGGDSAVGGAVSVSMEGGITTRGDHSRGIFAQSLGGSGGVGGSVVNAFLRLSGSATYGALGVGGQGGSGALGGLVTVENDATIVTFGERSDGILAQSIGGGGGLGGYAAALSLQRGEVPTGATPSSGTVSVGGSGGSGGDGGDVRIINTGVIATAGERAYGLRAKSVGGGGGIGGAVINLDFHGPRDSQSFSVNVGGSGGEGGDGGAVSILNEGLVVTEGREASALAAHSIGGGGGDGGIILDLRVGEAGSDRKTLNLDLNIGGEGGVGGDGGDVSVTNRAMGAENSGVLVTTGAHAYGVLAQSIGGGGGNGSSILSFTGVRTGSDSVNVGVNIGGSGGEGGLGGAVTVFNDGLIDTSGYAAHGVLAQSIGGGGGNAGVAMAASALIGAPMNAPLFSLGGFGGDGGDGGAVRVDNAGQIITRGDRAHGIVAQSIGGGGGNGHLGVSLTTEPVSFSISNLVSLAVGGMASGGTGGEGGEVVVNHSGDITVLGDGSMAIKAESINGGGGSLTFSMEGVVGLPGVPFVGDNGEPERPDPLLKARLGGKQQSDMNAGRVTVNTTGTFGVAGDNGAGGSDQSVGGGGGSVEIDLDLGTEPDDSQPDEAAPIDVEVVLGGEDGQNNNGGDIDSSHSGDIITTGQNSPGSIAQSVGGGGGRATVIIHAPEGALAGDIDLSLGGTNGQDEAGGDIERTHVGVVVTTGDLAPAVILQSIGGGGGSAGVVLTGDGATGSQVTAALGASGGSGLGGGDVTATLNGGIQTFGDHAVGLLVQSIGAGGGEVRAAGVSGLDATLGGENGAEGSGGDVSVTNTGAVITSGAGAHGVVLQSIGGGGGAVFGDVDDADVTLSDGGVGDGGAVSFHQTGDIIASGAGAHGLIAQSIGGGGGWVDGAFAGTAGGAGAGGAIDLFLDGQVFAPDEDSFAVFAQSLGADGGGNITIASSGLIRGGAAGLVIDGGADNEVTTSGSISAVSGLAVSATGGNDVIVNTGLVVGNIDLGGGDNAFVNAEGATYMAFDTIRLRDGAGGSAAGDPAPVPAGASSQASVARYGTATAVPLDADETDAGTADGAGAAMIDTFGSFGAGAALTHSQVAQIGVAQAVPAAVAAPATFTNAGTFLMGLGASRLPIDLAAGDVFGNLDHLGDPSTNLLYGARVITTVDLDGHFVQTDQGHMVFDAAFGPYGSDRVNVTGDAVVAGTGTVTLTWLENAAPVTLFATGGSGFDNGLEFEDTLAMDYSVLADAAGVHLTFVSDFGQPFLNANGQALGGHMDSALIAGGASGIGRMMAMLGNLQAGEEDLYAAIFDQLNPEPHLAAARAHLDSAQSFGDQIFTCGAAFGGANEGCVWGLIERVMAEGEADADLGAYGTEYSATRLRSGFERPVAGGWSFAGAVGYERLLNLYVDGYRAHTRGSAFNLGFGARHRSANGLEFGASVSGGWQWAETLRRVDVFQPGIGESRPESGYAQAAGHIAYTARGGPFFVRPALNGSVTVLRQQGFAEEGLGGLGARRQSGEQTFGTLNPELTLGVMLHESAASRAAFSITAGSIHHSEDRIEAPFRLMGADTASDPAVIASPLDPSGYHLGAELNIIGGDRLSFRFSYDGRFDDRSETHAAGFNMRLRF